MLMNMNQALSSRNTPVKPFALATLTPQERSRFTFQHYALRLESEVLFLTSYSPTAISDVACDSEVWTADRGKLFPSASITGLDWRMPTSPQSSGFQFIEGCTPYNSAFSRCQIRLRALAPLFPQGLG